MRQPAAGRPPRSYLTANLVLSALAAGVGGWVTATIAPQAGFTALGELSALVLVLGLVAQRSEHRRQVAGAVPGRQPSWYPVTITALGIVGVLAGGWLRLQ